MLVSTFFMKNVKMSKKSDLTAGFSSSVELSMKKYNFGTVHEILVLSLWRIITAFFES